VPAACYALLSLFAVMAIRAPTHARADEAPALH